MLSHFSEKEGLSVNHILELLLLLRRYRNEEKFPFSLSISCGGEILSHFTCHTQEKSKIIFQKQLSR